MLLAWQPKSDSAVLKEYNNSFYTLKSLFIVKGDFVIIQISYSKLP